MTSFKLVPSTEKLETVTKFVDTVFHDIHETENTFYTIHNEEIGDNTPWPYRSLNQVMSSVGEGTYHFCISSFKRDAEGHVKRRSQNFSAMHVLVLDDVGTKVSIDDNAIPPSYIVETSKGNYQYGYVLEKAIRDKELAANIIACVYGKGSKLTDTGGGMITKLVKLPYGRNIKPGRDNWEVRLVELNDTRYNWADLLMGWGLWDRFNGGEHGSWGESYSLPEGVDADVVRESDTLYKWLVDTGRVLSVGSNGYWRVECPRGHEHSNADRSAYYSPLGHGGDVRLRHFKCFHEHGEIGPPDTDEFLAFCREMGGPVVGVGSGQIGVIDMMKRAPTEIFPDRVGKRTISLLQTYENLEALIKWYNIGLEYDVFSRDVVCNSFKDTITSVDSLCQRNLLNLPSSRLTGYLYMNAMANERNRVVEYFNTLDGVNEESGDPIAEVFKCLPLDPDHDRKVCELMWRKWILQCVAAADCGKRTRNEIAIPKYESVLVLSGGQGMSKTTFLRGLVPMELRDYFKDGVLLKLKDKDSLIQTTRYWICELGEIDATFRKSDISEMKAFLSSVEDEFRVPYGRDSMRVRRHTSFCASVNDYSFLNDVTGNRRFWVLPLEGEITLPRTALLNRMWAYAWKCYLGGESWWIDYTQLQDVEEHTSKFTTMSDNLLIYKMHLTFGELSPKEVRSLDLTNANWYSTRDIAQIVDYEHATTGDIRTLSFHLKRLNIRMKTGTNNIRLYLLPAPKGNKVL